MKLNKLQWRLRRKQVPWAAKEFLQMSKITLASISLLARRVKAMEFKKSIDWKLWMCTLLKFLVSYMIVLQTTHHCAAIPNLKEAMNYLMNFIRAFKKHYQNYPFSKIITWGGISIQILVGKVNLNHPNHKLNNFSKTSSNSINNSLHLFLN